MSNRAEKYARNVARKDAAKASTCYKKQAPCSNECREMRMGVLLAAPGKHELRKKAAATVAATR